MARGHEFEGVSKVNPITFKPAAAYCGDLARGMCAMAVAPGGKDSRVLVTGHKLGT